MNNKINRLWSMVIGMMAFCLLATVTLQAQSVKKDKNADNWDKQWNDSNIKVFETYYLYPDFTYSVNYDKDGNIESVVIHGIDDPTYQNNLSAALTNIELMKKDMYNKPYADIYYVTETLAQPKGKITDFYRELQSNIEYPEAAKNGSVEGTVFVKFVVEPDGTVDHIQTFPRFEKDHYIIKDLEKEAKQAVMETSGDWVPAKVGDLAVASWRMLPVRFDIQPDPAVAPPLSF